MKVILGFFRTTLVGGVVVLLPVAISAWIILKLLRQLDQIVAPLAKQLPPGIDHPRLLAILLLVMLCFFLGLVVRTTTGKSAWAVFQRSVLDRVPGYKFIRGMTERIAGLDEQSNLQPAFLQKGDALVPVFVVERHDDGRCTVFLPSAPTPTSGSISIVDGSNVLPLNISLMKTVRCLSRWGSGSSELLAALKTVPLPADPNRVG